VIVGTRNTEAASIEAMADQIMALTRLTWASRLKLRKARADELTNTEFLALDFLERDAPLTVGQLQRRIGILPAQMSRVIKALEKRFPKKLVSCTINATDKRKIDLALTDAGRRTLASFKKVRLAYCIEALRMLSEADRLEFMRIVRLLQASFQKQAQAARTAAETGR